MPAPSAAPELDAGRAAIPSPDAATPADDLAAVPAACRGEALSLDAIMKREVCDVRGSTLPSPSAASLTLSATLATQVVARGGSAPIVLTMTNASSARLVFDLDLSCGEEVRFGVEAFDAKRKRVDQVGECGGVAMLCQNRVIRIALEPGGAVTKNLTFRPTVTRLDRHCAELSAGTLKPGRYTLDVKTPLHDPAKAESRRSATTHIEVQ